MEHSTHAVLLTPPGVSAIATIRIAGPRSLNLLQNIFRPHKTDATVSYSTEKLHYGALYENEDILDKVIVATDPVKKTVDIHCHGGSRIVQRLLMLLQKQDVEIIPWQQRQPAESIADEVELTLPFAKTRLAVLAIAAQHPGGLSAWIRSQIAKLQNKANFLDEVKKNLHLLLKTYEIAQNLLNPPTITLVGPVNVGKSTLANALTGRRQSITADLPGTTRDWTAQLVDLNGLPVNLIDTPGRRDIGDTPGRWETGEKIDEQIKHQDDKIEEQALLLAEKQVAQADLIVLVIEAGARENEQIENQRTQLPNDKDILIVANKSDLLDRVGTAKTVVAPSRDSTAVAHIESKDYLYVSALKETNLDQLRSAIVNYFGLSNFDPQQPLIFTQRQYNLLSEILNHPPSAEAVIQRLQSVM